MAIERCSWMHFILYVLYVCVYLFHPFIHSTQEGSALCAESSALLLYYHFVVQVKVALLQMICLAWHYSKLKTKLPFVMRAIAVIKELG